MKYDFIGITKQNIRGVVNPGLTIQGVVQKKNYSFLVEVDGKEQKDFDVLINSATGDFTLTAILDKKSKNIKVYVIVDKVKYLIYKGKNTHFGRVRGKIKDVFFPIFVLIRSIFITLGKGICYLWHEYHFLVPPRLWGKFWKDFKLRVRQRGMKYFYNPFHKYDYHKWLDEFSEDTEVEELKYQPLISILIPVYNIGRTYLEECIDSILGQSYEHFEICLVDDCSTNEETLNTLKEYEEKDERIHVKYRKKNGHISKASNDALKMAKGEFIALVDNDDTLDCHALYEVVKVLNQNKELDFIYSDEDKLDLKGERCDPNFKPDWSPDTLLSLNYICHLSVLRKSIVDKLGGFTVGLEGAQDYDLFLRVTEETNRIHHIPKILYHWRMVEGSTSMTIDNKSYAVDKGKKALENALKRRNIDADVLKDEKSPYYIVDYHMKKEPLVSIIIPTKDLASTLDTCLTSLFQKTTYKNFEVIVVNNNSEEDDTFALFDRYKKLYKNFKVLDANFEFNYSKINNMAVKKCKGEYICLLNNDTEIISPNWLSVMVSYASQPHIGAVGPKLLYPDETVQHGGVILGLGGVASHAYIGASKSDVGMYGRLRVPYNYSAVTAACLVVSKRKYLEVQGLEEKLKVAYNDIDFNIKLLEKGYYNVFVPQVELFHFESKSRGYDTTSEKYQRFLKEEAFMYEKWKNRLDYDCFYNQNFSQKYWFVLPMKKEEK